MKGFDIIYIFNGWLLLGFFAQGIFVSRFIVQWIISERKKMSTIPKVLKDPVFILGQSFNSIIYVRNLMLFKG